MCVKWVRLAIFGKSAPRYDSEIGFDETVMGLNLLRRWMLWKANGDVLEVGGGTGERNHFCDRYFEG